MAMTNEQETKLEELFRSELQKQYLRGIRAGIQTCSKVCIDKLNDSSKPLMKRIEGVKKYCAVALQSGFLTKGIDETSVTENESEIKEVETEPTVEENSDENIVIANPQ